ncbi:hypothetical protein WJX82_000935 [Trebouxia sp. C0006]
MLDDMDDQMQPWVGPQMVSHLTAFGCGRASTPCPMLCPRMPLAKDQLELTQ